LQSGVSAKGGKHGIRVITHREYTVTVKGRIVIATEWLSWRKQGLSNTEIAHMLGVSLSIARIIARKFRQAGLSDLQYWKRKSGPVKIIDTTTDAGAYVLGILWGTATTSDGGYWCATATGVT